MNSNESCVKIRTLRRILIYSIYFKNNYNNLKLFYFIVILRYNPVLCILFDGLTS